MLLRSEFMNIELWKRTDYDVVFFYRLFTWH